MPFILSCKNKGVFNDVYTRFKFKVEEISGKMNKSTIKTIKNNLNIYNNAGKNSYVIRLIYGC